MPHNDNDHRLHPTSPHGYILAEIGDLGLDEHAYNLVRVLYLAYQRRVLRGLHNLGEPGPTEGHAPMNDLPNLDELAAEATRDGIVHRSVAVAVDHGDRILLLRRRHDAELHPGRWELPTATAYPGEHLLITLDRTLGETTGLTIDEILSYLGHHDLLAPDGQKTRQYTFVVSIEHLARFRVGGDYTTHRWELADGTTSVVDDSVTTLLEQFQIASPAPRRQIEER